jgi:D-alanyl-D-alanine carboxypeptidase
VWQGKENPLFKENKRLLTKWKKAAAEAGVNARIGRWNVPGAPIAILVDFQPFFDVKNDIYAEAWDAFQVDSLHAYGDYDEASMFSYAAGKFVEAVVKAELLKGESIIYQAHEWMSGLGMLFLKKECPEVATIFTTHATSIGRSIAGNNKLLYNYFHGYNGDQMAAELSMEAKHSIEKQSAHGADCFTTVSMFTDRECKQLLDKPADVVLPNGFENDFVPKGAAFTKKRKEARQCILNVASKLIGEELDDTTLIVSTSGRNDFRCKGFDVYMEALAQLNARMKTLAQAEEELVSQKVLALIEVPCWTKEPRQDLLARLNGTDKSEGGLHTPMITHDLHNLNEDRILCLIKQLGLWNTKNDVTIKSKGKVSGTHILHSSVFSTDSQGHYANQLTDYYSMLGGKTGTWSSPRYNMIGGIFKGPNDTILSAWLRRNAGEDSSNNRWHSMKILMDIAFAKIQVPSADVSSLESALVNSGVNSAQVLQIPNGYPINYELFDFYGSDSRYTNFAVYGYMNTTQLPIASTTKVLTAITVLDYISDLERLVEIVASDIVAGSTSTNPEFSVGEKFTVRELLLSMMLPSSNAAANALARYVGSMLLLNKTSF